MAVTKRPSLCNSEIFDSTKKNSVFMKQHRIYAAVMILKKKNPNQFLILSNFGKPHGFKNKTSSYPGWIKSPHVVTLGILKLSDLDSLTIFIGGGGILE